MSSESLIKIDHPKTPSQSDSPELQDEIASLEYELGVGIVDLVMSIDPDPSNVVIKAEKIGTSEDGVEIFVAEIV